MRLRNVVLGAVLVVAPACGGSDHGSSGTDANTSSTTAVPSGRGSSTGQPSGTDASTSSSTQPPAGRGGATGQGGTGEVPNTATTAGSTSTTGPYTQR